MASSTGSEKIILVLLALFFPPLPILMVNGFKFSQKQFLLCLLLTFLGHFPGLVYSLYYLFSELPRNASTGHKGAGVDENSVLPDHGPPQATLPSVYQSGQKLDGAPPANVNEVPSENPPSYTESSNPMFSPHYTKETKYKVSEGS